MGLFTRLRRFGKSLNMNYDEIKDWYDGYQFGNTRVYCPWDVVNYCDALRSDPEAPPKNYWSNTSSNEVVRRFIAGDRFRLAIPNMEIRKIFTTQIMELFKENVPKNGEMLNAFCRALRDGEAREAERLLGEYLKRTISIRDTFVKKRLKENRNPGLSGYRAR